MTNENPSTENNNGGKCVASFIDNSRNDILRKLVNVRDKIKVLKEDKVLSTCSPVFSI